MSIVTIGIDLAKTIFAVHGVNERGKAERVKPKVPRARLLPPNRQPATVPNRHGSLQRLTPLGAPVPSTRPHGPAHRSQVCQPVSDEREARQKR
jgi:hypothetical protein